MSITLEDKFAIRELYAEYCFTVDRRDDEGWVNCFTPDGEFDPLGDEFYKGRDELFAYMASVPNPHYLRHLMSNVSFADGPDGVRGRCNALVIDYSGPDPRIKSSVVYDDLIVKHDGEWRFARRSPKRDAPRPTA